LNRRKAAWGVLILIAVALLFFVQSRIVRNRAGFISLPTTYDTGVNGLKAFFLLLGELGHGVDRFEETPASLEKRGVRGLVVISPFPQYLDRQKAREIYNWAAGGRRLLVAADGDSPFWDLLSVKTHRAPGSQQRLKGETGSSLAAGVEYVQVSGSSRFRLPPAQSHPFQVHLQDSSGVICASARVGEGEVFILSAPEMFSNVNVSQESNVIFLANLCRALGERGISFDETIHGILKDGKSYVLPETARAVLWQLGVALLLFYAVYLLRFGSPRPLWQGRVRASTEFVHSLAGLFKRADSRKFALDNLARGFRRKILKPFGVSPDLPDDRFMELVRLIPGLDEGTVAALLERCSKDRAAQKLPQGELVALARQMEALVKGMK